MSLHWQARSDRGADPWVVEVLWWGYRIPFRSVPPLSLEPIPFPAYTPSSIRGNTLEREVHILDWHHATIVIHVWKLHPFAQYPSRKMKCHCVILLLSSFWFDEPFLVEGSSCTTLQGGLRNVY